MKEFITDFLIALILAGVCGIGSYMLKTRKAEILGIVHDLIQKAEEKIQGSGMGAEKKALVVTQLEAMGIKLTAWLDAEIDTIVKELNEKEAWYCDHAKNV
jgi:hypothetical protein